MAKKTPPPPAEELPENEAEQVVAVVEPPLRVGEPGIYEMDDRSYHADPCPEPSLSRSVLKEVVDFSPAHGYAAHPRLGGSPDDGGGSDDEVMDFGTAAHASFLQNRSVISRLDFRDWKTNAAKAARAQAYADGMIPLLPRPYSRAMRLIDVLESFRARTGAFTQGRPEQTVVWREENGIWCRCRIDWLPDEPSAPCFDLKTTGGRATLQAWSRICFDKGADLQDVFYARGLEMVRGEPPAPMKFVVIEQKPPHAIRVFIMAPSAREQAEHDVYEGISTWGNCLETGQFPAYNDTEAEYVFPPSWVTRAREERAVGSKLAQQVAFNRRAVPSFIGEHPNALTYVETDDFGG